MNTDPILTDYLVARYEAEEAQALVKALEAEKAQALINTPEWMLKFDDAFDASDDEASPEA